MDNHIINDRTSQNNASTTKSFPYEFTSNKPIKIYSESSRPPASILEIGPGRGDFLLHLAQSYPRECIAAIEIRRHRCHKLSAQLQRQAITNVILYEGDARVIVPRFWGEDSLQALYVLFPDPWPKQRHAFHRLLSLEFLWLVAFLLRQNGQFLVATDVKKYAEDVADLLRRIPWLKPSGLSEIVTNPTAGFPTFFQQKWRRMGRDVYYLHSVKVCMDATPLSAT